MSKQVEKIISKREAKKNSKLRKWLHKNAYKVCRVLLFYIWIPMWLVKQYKNYHYRKITWNEETAKKILDYYIPRRAKIDHEENCLWYCRQWYPHFSRDISRKYKTFVSKCYFELVEYLMNEYQLEGYIKTTETDFDETWLKFEKV